MTTRLCPLLSTSPPPIYFLSILSQSCFRPQLFAADFAHFLSFYRRPEAAAASRAAGGRLRHRGRQRGIFPEVAAAAAMQQRLRRKRLLQPLPLLMSPPDHSHSVTKRARRPSGNSSQIKRSGKRSRWRWGRPTERILLLQRHHRRKPGSLRRAGVETSSGAWPRCSARPVAARWPPTPRWARPPSSWGRWRPGRARGVKRQQAHAEE